MRCDDVARGVVAVLEPVGADVDDALPASLGLLVTPLLLSVLGDALVAPDTPLEPLGDSFDVLGEVLGDVLLGDAELGAVLLDASAGVLVLGAVLPGVLAPLLGAGSLRLTSPVEVPVTVPDGDALFDGTQSVVIAEADAPALVDADIPFDVVLGLVMLPLADARSAAESLAVIGGVTPVPLAPFVVFKPVKRCSGFVAGLRAESVAAAVVALELLVDVELGLIVVADVYPVVLVLAPARIGGQGVPFALVRCCAPADAASAAPSTSVMLAARHRARLRRSIPLLLIVASGLSALLAPPRARGRVGRAAAGISCRDRVSVPHDGFRRGLRRWAQCACPRRSILREGT